MKRVWLIAGMVAIMATAHAQQRPQSEKSPTERAERQTAALNEALDLTEEQQSAVSKINLKYAEEIASLREEQRKAREEERARREEVRQKKEAELKGILSDEQMEKYQEHQEKRKEHRGDRGKRRHRG